MIALYAQVFVVITLVVVAATAFGNEIRLWIDERHEEQAYQHVGRHRETDDMRSLAGWLRPVLYRAQDTARLFADTREAFASAAPTEWITRSTA